MAGIFFVNTSQSRASTRKSRSGLFLYYGFALASRAGIFFVNASQAEPGRNSRSRFSFSFALPLAFIVGIFFVNASQTESGCNSRSRLSFFIRFIRLSSRVFSGYLFCHHFPAASGCSKKHILLLWGAFCFSPVFIEDNAIFIAKNTRPCFFQEARPCGVYFICFIGFRSYIGGSFQCQWKFLPIHPPCLQIRWQQPRHIRQTSR